DATVSAYATNVVIDISANALGNVFTTAAPTSTATTQTTQSGSVTFVAPATSCYIVFAKNPASTSAFLSYIDDLVLTKTAEASRQILSNVSTFSFNSTTRADTMLITGSLLSDSIRITAPDGITVSPKVLPSNAGVAQVIVSFKGFYSLTGNITLTSGDVVKTIPLTTTYSTSFITPVAGAKYYIQQRTGGKVIGMKTGGASAALRYAVKDDSSQLFEFVPVSGKTNTYYILSGENKYLSKVKATAQNTQLEFTDTAVAPDFSEWVIQGTADTLVYLTQASDAAKNIGSDSIVDNKPLYNDKASSLTNCAFALQKTDALNAVYMFDPNFENCPVDGGPLGTWIPANDPIQLGMYGYSRVQGGNSWASSGKKCMYLRFLGDATSYNSISQKVFSLSRGATYRLDLQYKVQSTSATALVNIYAATTANADKAAAIGGLYTTTTASASNLATQTAQSTSLTFVAPASSVYIVYAKNTTGTNYNFFIDNLVLTETKPSALNEVEMNSLFKTYIAGERIAVDFELINTGGVEFSVCNIQGQILFQQKMNCEQGQNRKVLDIDLPTGVYLVRMLNNGLSTTLKVIK
ncbi:MAG TPA: T9SS type A sorting domain-containing protein, partial [Paludibacter sp.]|nr:T9SS type A sorting domain-containing protein [Paludibacter sp.]